MLKLSKNTDSYKHLKITRYQSKSWSIKINNLPQFYLSTAYYAVAGVKTLPRIQSGNNQRQDDIERSPAH